MAIIFYCKDETDYKKVAVHIFNSEINNNSLEDAIKYSGILTCSFNKDEEFDWCEGCELEDCLLVDKLGDKDIYKEIEVYQLEEVYPLLVVYDSDLDGIVQYVSINNAKSNTKYGIE